MTDEEFIRVRLRGGRFKDGSIPLSVLYDLYTLQMMIVDLAGWRFKERTKRVRLPRKFDQIYLKLTGLGSGSSVATIGIGTTRQVLSGVPYQEYFDKSADDIVDVVRSAEQGNGVLDLSIPNQHLKYFNYIGYDLQDDESLEFKSARRDVSARLTPKSRELLARHSGATDIARHLTLRGTVPEADQKKMTFRLQQVYGPTVQCQIPARYINTIKDAFSGYKDGTRILVEGRGILDNQNHISRIDPVVHIKQLDPLDMDSRLDEFRSVQDGWLEDGGVAPDHAGLDWLSVTFALHYPDDLPLPYTYLTADGGISLEWSFGTKDITVEIDIQTHKGEWYMYDNDTKSIADEIQMDLDKQDCWAQLAKRLWTLQGGGND